MVIHLSKELLAKARDGGKEAVLVNMLFSLFVLERHQWLVPLEDDLELLNSVYLAAFQEFIERYVTEMQYDPMPDATRIVRVFPDELVEIQAQHAAESGTMELCVHVPGLRVSVKSDERRLDFIGISLVDPYLVQRLNVVVEDVKSDGAFVQTCIAHFANKPNCESSFKISHGGGSSILAVLRNLGGTERAVCIIDGDHTGPSEISHEKAQMHSNIQEICKSLGYDFHKLQKREIENYIPDAALRKWLDERGFQGFHPYFSLSETEKDYVDMKRRAQIKQPPASAVVPSDSTDESAVAVAPMWSSYGFADDVWKAFSYVTASEELETRDSTGELKHLVNIILDNL